MEEMLIGAVVEAIKLSPAVVILFWQAWRSDLRAQQCIERLFDLLPDKER